MEHEVTPRLGPDTLGSVPSSARPAYDPRALHTGIVHLGAGAFFRAHPAAYTDDVVAAGDHRWGIHASSQRSPAVSDSLAAQDGLFSLLQRPTEGPPDARVLGVVRGSACVAADPEPVLRALGDPHVHVVTLTVTEKGYRSDGSGRLRLDDDVTADLAGRPPRTVAGLLVRGIQRRAAAGAGPLTVVSCDNLSGNGPLLRQLVLDFAGRLGGSPAAEVMDWIERHATFPATMVDRIVPATTDDDRSEVARLLGVSDEAAVVAEPFRQWVIADSFAGPRPTWEDAGAIVTDDVAGYERVKLRLLNATHSLIAYLGALAGHQTIHAALRDPLIEAAARALTDDDQMPTITAPGGMDLGAYRDEVLRRFANPALRHSTAQVAMDGSQKLPQRLLVAIRERRASGAVPVSASLLLAAWMRFLAGQDDDGNPLEVSDPMAADLRRLVDGAGPAGGIVRRVVTDAFGPDLAEDGALMDCVAGWFDALRTRGVHEALRSRQAIG